MSMSMTSCTRSGSSMNSSSGSNLVTKSAKDWWTDLWKRSLEKSGKIKSSSFKRCEMMICVPTIFQRLKQHPAPDIRVCPDRPSLQAV